MRLNQSPKAGLTAWLRRVVNNVLRRPAIRIGPQLQPIDFLREQVTNNAFPARMPQRLQLSQL
jgi:hypothetical protein